MFPNGVERVTMGGFKNRSGETGVEGIITNDIVYEFTRNGKKIFYGGETADAVLSGSVLGVSTQSVSRKSIHSVVERRVVVSISLRLTDLKGAVIWQASKLTENEEYAVSSDKGTTEMNKREAILTLSKRLAEKVYYRMTDDF
jgi:hypothetical protein